MILHHKGLKIDVKLLKFKKGFKYSDDLSFIPISYDKKELLLQSPNMYIPFEVKKYTDESKKKYLDLTFQTSSDKDTNDLININTDIYSIKKIDNHILRQIHKELRIIENELGKKFGDIKNPLLEGEKISEWLINNKYAMKYNGGTKNDWGEYIKQNKLI